MNEVFLIAADYLKGKSVYPPIRRIMDLLFNISIASFLYEKFYGQYSWLNYKDYKGILDFFVKGNFFIPFSIFIAVYGATYFISLMIFSLANHFKTIKWTRQILYYQITRETIDNRLKEINRASKLVSPIRLTKPLMIQLFTALKNEIPPDAYNQMEKALREPKQNIESNFHTAFRCLIAITIYFFSIPQFGWILFLVVVATLWTCMYVLMLAYRFLDILPALVRRMQSEAEKYILEHQKENEQK